MSCSRFQVASQYSGKSEGCQSREESINPDDDDRVLVYNRGLDDLLKTPVADGDAANWSVLDAAMDFDPGDLVIDENEGDPTGHFLHWQQRCRGHTSGGDRRRGHFLGRSHWRPTRDLCCNQGCSAEAYLIRHAHPHLNSQIANTFMRKKKAPTRGIKGHEGGGPKAKPP